MPVGQGILGGENAAAVDVRVLFPHGDDVHGAVQDQVVQDWLDSLINLDVVAQRPVQKLLHVLSVLGILGAHGFHLDEVLVIADQLGLEPGLQVVHGNRGQPDRDIGAPLPRPGLLLALVLVAVAALLGLFQFLAPEFGVFVFGPEVFAVLGQGGFSGGIVVLFLLQLHAGRRLDRVDHPQVR